MEDFNETLKAKVASDDKFKAKARMLQSMYRHNQGWEMGSKPRGEKGEKLGSIILNGETNGQNFLLTETFQYAKERLASKRPVETIDAQRLFCNMLSSMPMCFNLFHPLSMLIGSEDLNTAFQKLFPELNIARITDIKIEFIPEPIEKYTNDKSAFDTLVVYETPDHKTGIIAVETKYVEPLGSNKGSDREKKIAVAIETAMFTKEGIDSIKNGCTQVYRNFLLTEAYRMREGYDYSHSIILSPEENKSSHKELRKVRQSLKPEFHDKIVFYPLEKLVKVLAKNISEPQEHWIEQFGEKYLVFK